VFKRRGNLASEGNFCRAQMSCWLAEVIKKKRPESCATLLPLPPTRRRRRPRPRRPRPRLQTRWRRIAEKKGKKVSASPFSGGFSPSVLAPRHWKLAAAESATVSAAKGDASEDASEEVQIGRRDIPWRAEEDVPRTRILIALRRRSKRRTGRATSTAANAGWLLTR